MTKRRYVTLHRQPRMDDEDYCYNDEMQRDLTVYEREPVPQETGLLDKHGNALYAIDEREPIGFVHFRGGNE